MKFALMIYQPHPFNPTSLPPDEHKAIAAEYAAVTATTGVTAGPPLGLPSNAVTVRVIEGATQATDGPRDGVANAVGGFLILEAQSIEAAVALAARIPAARLGGAVEVRPCAVYW